VGAGRTTTGRTGVRAIRLESLAWLRFQHGSLCHRRVATVAESQEDSMMRTKPPNEESKLRPTERSGLRQRSASSLCRPWRRRQVLAGAIERAFATVPWS